MEHIPNPQSDVHKNIRREVVLSGHFVILVLTLAGFSTLSMYLHLREIYFPETPPPEIFHLASTYKMNLRDTFIAGAMIVLTMLFFIRYQLSLLLRAKLNMPMVPSLIPFFGTAFQFMNTSPWDLMEFWHRRYGPIYSFTLLGRTCVAIEDPVFLREVLQSKIQHVKKDVHFSYKPFLPILGKGIVTSEGQSWMKQRLKISTTLKFDVLDIIPTITLKAVQRLMEKMDSCATEGTSIDIGEELRHLTLQVISGTFLSLDPKESDATFAQMYLPIVEEGNKRVWSPERSYMFFAPFFWKHRWGVHRLNEYVSSLVVKRWMLRQEEKRTAGQSLHIIREQDVLDRVLAHYEHEYPDVKEIPADGVEQIRDEFKTFMLAGHETSAAMMMWTLFELIQNVDLMEKVVRESDSVFGSDFDCRTVCIDAQNKPNRESLSKLVLAEACLKEALRKYSVVPTVLRRNVSPLKIGNHDLPQDCSVIISIQSVHHNKIYWPEPMKFDPYRFLDLATYHEPYTFLPFIDGPRNCLGQYLALLESKMVISMLARRYKLTFATSAYSDGSDPRHRFIVPIITKSSLTVNVTKR